MLASNLHTKHVMVKCNTNVQLKIQPFLFKIKSSLGFQSDIIFFIYCFQSSEMERKQIWNKHIQLVTTQCLSVCLLTLKSLRSQIRGIGYISQFPPNCHLAYSRLTLKLRNLNHPKCYSFRGCGGGKKKSAVKNMNYSRWTCKALTFSFKKKMRYMVEQHRKTHVTYRSWKIDYHIHYQLLSSRLGTPKTLNTLQATENFCEMSLIGNSNHV